MYACLVCVLRMHCLHVFVCVERVSIMFLSSLCILVCLCSVGNVYSGCMSCYVCSSVCHCV